MAVAVEASLTSDRRDLLWVGGEIPEEVRLVATTLGLQAARAQIGDVDSKRPGLHSILVSMDDLGDAKAFGRLKRALAQNPLDYGVMLGIVSANYGQATELQARVLKSTSETGLAPDSLPVIPLSIEELSRYLRLHNPGPSADQSIQFQFRSGDPPESTDEILLRRAFHGFSKLELSEETGGRSEACRVWRVVAHNPGHRHEPYVAKVAKRLALETERATYNEFVLGRIPFPFRAPLVEARFVQGTSRAVLVSMFVDRAQRLDRYLATATSPELVVTSLFTSALHNFRASAELVRNETIGRIYVDRQKTPGTVAQAAHAGTQLLPAPTALVRAYTNAKKTRTGLPSPIQLWDMLSKAGRIDFYQAPVHGDLNVRNVFVRWNSVDAVLIDFSHCGQIDPLARDPAKLDVSIALTARDGKNEFVTVDALPSLYRHPLLPPLNLEAVDGPTAAIRQIRRQAGGEGITTVEYEILVACHLLRYASASPNQHDGRSNRRAIAYALACDLIAEQTTRGDG